MKEPTLKKVAYGAAMAIAVILVHLVNEYAYKMPPMFAIFLAIFFTYLGIRLIRKSDKFDKKISRTQYNLLNLVVVLVLVVSYFTITQ